MTATADPQGASRNPIVRLWIWGWNLVVRYALKFGVIGIIGYVIDVGIFNALSLGALGHGHFFQGPVGAKIISVSVATLATWFGNRYWTFREHRRQNFILELVEFAAVAVGGLMIGLICLWISHYLLGLTSLLADNISGNIVGLFLGTAFRFVLYRYWVYGHHRRDGLTARQNRVVAAESAIFEDEAAVNAETEIDR